MIAGSKRYMAGSGLGPMLIKAVVGTAGLRLAGMGCGFLIGVLLARGLGADGYGVYGIAMSIIALLTVPTEFGMPQLVTREVAKAQVQNNNAHLRGVLRWATRSIVGISVALALLVVVWLVSFGGGLTSRVGTAVVMGLVMVPLVALANVKGAALRGMQHIVKGQLPDTLIRPFAFAGILFLVPLLTGGLTPVSAMISGVLSAAIGLVGAAWLLVRHMPADEDAPHPVVDTKGWWASAFPMAMTEGMRGLQGNAAILIMGWLMTEAAVGVFRVAQSVSALVWFPVTMFLLVGSPVISRLHAAGEKEKLQRLLGWLAAGMTLGSALLMLPFLFAGEELLGAVFGAEFAMANQPLLILCAGGIIFSCLGPGVILLNMTGHERRVSRAFAISVVSLVVVAPPLVHFFGGNGAAVATVVGVAIGSSLMWRDASRLLGFDSSIVSMFRGRIARWPSN